MDGRFEDYTLGRNITMERVKDIYKLSLKHDFKLAGLRSFGKYVTDEDLAARRALAEQYRRDPALFASVRPKRSASSRTSRSWRRAQQSGSFDKRWLTVGALGAAVGAAVPGLVGRLRR